MILSCLTMLVGLLLPSEDLVNLLHLQIPYINLIKVMLVLLFPLSVQLDDLHVIVVTIFSVQDLFNGIFLQKVLQFGAPHIGILPPSDGDISLTHEKLAVKTLHLWL